MDYVNNRNYEETMFVFVIMVIAATRPILKYSIIFGKKSIKYFTT